MMTYGLSFTHFLTITELVMQNSNIVNFFSMLKKDDPKEQLVYYQVLTFASLRRQQHTDFPPFRQELGHTQSLKLPNR